MEDICLCTDLTINEEQNSIQCGDTCNTVRETCQSKPYMQALLSDGRNYDVNMVTETQILAGNKSTIRIEPQDKIGIKV